MKTRLEVMKDIQREVMRSLEGTESELILDETSFTTTKKRQKPTAFGNGTHQLNQIIKLAK